MSPDRTRQCTLNFVALQLIHISSPDDKQSLPEEALIYAMYRTI